MRKIAIAVLIVCAVIVSAYVIYFILGRPPIPLPAVKYTVSQGSRINDIIKATESDRVTITWVTSGKIEALADGQSMAGISYDMDSLDNSLALVEKFALPRDTQVLIKNINRIFPPSRTIPKIAVGFFYYVIRLKLTVVLLAN